MLASASARRCLLKESDSSYDLMVNEGWANVVVQLSLEPRNSGAARP